MVTKEGKCVACPDYTRSSSEDDNVSCKLPEFEPDCNSKTYVTQHGMCVDCSEGKGGNWNDIVNKGRECVKQKCLWNQRDLDDGTCETCDDGKE